MVEYDGPPPRFWFCGLKGEGYAPEDCAYHPPEYGCDWYQVGMKPMSIFAKENKARHLSECDNSHCHHEAHWDDNTHCPVHCAGCDHVVQCTCTGSGIYQ